MITNKNGFYAFPYIIACMAENGDTIASLAADLGMGYQALSARLQGKKAFELPEVFGIMSKYKKTFDELFGTKQQPA